MANNTNVDEMVNSFIEKLITEAGMGNNMEADALAELKRDLSERLNDRINAVLLSQIPPHKLEEFEKLLDSGDSAKTQAFCAENIPNLSELIAAELLGFRKRYIA